MSPRKGNNNNDDKFDIYAPSNDDAKIVMYKAKWDSAKTSIVLTNDNMKLQLTS